MNWKSTFVTGLVLCGSVSSYSYVSAQQVSPKETEQLDFAQGLLSRGMYDMAVDEYRKFISTYPQSTYLDEAYLAVGESYFLAGDFPKATDAFNYFKQNYPHSSKIASALLRLAQIDIKQKKYDDAMKELTSIDAESQLKGENLQSFDFYMAKAYRGKEDMANAFKYFQMASQVPDANTYKDYALQELAEIDVENGQYKEAIDAYARATQSTQDKSSQGYYVYKIGETQFLAGDYKEAIDHFHQVIEQYPDLDVTKDALTNLLLSYFNLGQYDQSLQEYQTNAKLIKEDSHYVDVHIVAVRDDIELKKYDDALALLNKIATWSNLTPDDQHKIIFKKADILIKQNQYPAAISLLEADGVNADKSDEGAFLKAQAYYGVGKYDQAASLFGQVESNFPKSNFAKASILGMAHANQEAGKYQEAANIFLKYYTSEKDERLRSEALYDAVLMQIKLKNNDQAILNAQEYLKVFPQGSYYEQTLLLLAETYAQNHQYDKGITLLQGYLSQAQDIKKVNAVYFLLAYDLQMQGQNDQALATYAKVTLNKDESKFYASALKNSAIIVLNQKKDAEATVFFARLINELDQNNLELKSYLWLCNEYLKEGKYKEVLPIAQKAEQYFPGQSQQEIAYFKAEAYRGDKDFDNAQKLYDVVLSFKDRNTYSGGAHIGKSLCLSNAKNFDEAKAELQKAIDENDDDPTITLRARFEIANIATMQNNLDEALKFYLLVGTIYDDKHYCPESLIRAAGILENLKRNAEALHVYQDILDKYKDSPEAAKANERVVALSEHKN